MSRIPVPFSLIVREKMERQRIGTISYPIGQTRRRVRTEASTWPHTTILVLLVALIIAGLSLLYLWQGTMIRDLTAQRESAQATLTSTEEVNRWLEFKIDQVFSLARVSRIAREELHMVEPSTIHYVQIDPPQKETGKTGRRVLILALILAAAALLIVGRLVELQVVEHEHWLAAASAMQERTVELLPRRGTIYDRNGVPLAFDVKAVAIAIDSFNMTKPETLVTILSEELGRSREDLRALLYRQSYFTWIDRTVDLEAAKAIERRAKDAFAYGLIFIDTWKRCYPQGTLASNIIGFVGTDGHGLEGVELAFDEVLSGASTTIHVLKGADGRTYRTETIEEGAPGEDLYLTIDSRVQFACEEEIDNGVARFRANTGFIVLLDPVTGDVLAMAQDRRYDLNRFWTSTAEDRRNLAVSFLFEPGSSFKAFTGWRPSIAERSARRTRSTGTTGSVSPDTRCTTQITNPSGPSPSPR